MGKKRVIVIKSINNPDNVLFVDLNDKSIFIDAVVDDMCESFKINIKEFLTEVDNYGKD